MSRQNYYKQRQTRSRRQVDEGLVVALVARERRLQPRLGGKKLHGLLSEELFQAGIEIGRDRFFDVLRDHDMLVKPLPPTSHRTTDSRHSLPVFRNLIRNLEPTGPDQIWVSDITYIRTLEGFEYLTLIMDLYSRKIVGFHCDENLDAEANLIALNRALQDLPANRYPIHHSDRGCQYCCHEYVEVLQSRDLPVSMTEENHCYENAHAERLNGILKQELGLGWTFKNREQARRAVEQAVWIYNTRRPHGSLKNQMPARVHTKAA
jgi:transposase InsO family protein